MTEQNQTPEAQAEVKEPKIEKNGVVRPRTGTGTAKVWEIADALSAAANAPAKRKEVLDECTKQSINVSTAATQYGKWRKFHGLEREVKEAKPTAAPTPTETAPTEAAE